MQAATVSLSAGARRSIDPNVSLTLDILRFSLAFAVAAGHWTQPYFQDGWTDHTRFGMAAVGGFFVLSGFTIRMLTPTGDFSLARYGIERLSRLWSVVLPALLLTMLLDLASYQLDPRHYLAYWRTDTDFPMLRLVLNALFLAQHWGYGISPLSNSPFWSVSYEAWFYVLFGLFMARRWLWLACAAALAGANILYLLMLWLIGAGAFWLFERANTPKRLSGLFATSASLTGLAVLLLATRWPELRAIAEAAQNAYFGLFGVSAARVQPEIVVSGLVFAPALLALLSGAKLLCGTLQAGPSLVKIGRTIGDFTFPLYLLHFPIFVLCSTIGFYDRTSVPQKIGVFVVVCGAIFLLAPLAVGFKLQLRRLLTRLWADVKQKAPQRLWGRYGALADRSGKTS